MAYLAIAIFCYIDATAQIVYGRRLLGFLLNEKVRAHYQFIAQRKMADSMDDVAKQARQGSVAAIIQLMNEKLADSGVRTRAMVAEGVLQILCEAATAEQLEQSALVNRIREILEALAPRNIRRININSRIVREQQLLWLEEINRDPENQLLWSERITLNKPNLWQQMVEDLKNYQPGKNQPSLPKPASYIRENRQFWRGIFGGASVSLILIVLAWTLYGRLGSKSNSQTPSLSSGSSPSLTTSPTAVRSPSSDTFAEAVRLAQQASIAGRNAKTSAQWLDIAAKWQRASDLMANVPPSDSHYKTAINRIGLYRQNSDTAQKEAQNKRQN